MHTDRTAHVFDDVNCRGSFRRLQKQEGIVVWKFKAAPQGAKVFFTTRHGGSSPTPYDSLNLGFHVGDDPLMVRENRRRLAVELEVDPASITCPRQGHTAEVAVVRSEDQIGSGALREESVFDPCDGLITSLKRAPILLHFADCLPVVLVADSGSTAAGNRCGTAAARSGGSTADRSSGRKSVAVLHAGREGLLQGVIANGVKAMAEEMQVAPDLFTAALGPAIGPCCYEVGEAITTSFRNRFGEAAVVNDTHLDLAAAAVIELRSAGVSVGNIHLLDTCTACDHDFYSYRRDGVTGRHGAIAWIDS